MKKNSVSGIVHNGKIRLDDFNDLKHVLSLFEGQAVEINIAKQTLKKTDNQYAYYWGVIIRKHMMDTEQFGGWTVNEIHNYLGSKIRLKTVEIKLPRHEGSEQYYVSHNIIQSTKAYSKAQFAEYIKEVLLFLVWEHGIEIPDLIKNQEHGNKT